MIADVTSFQDIFRTYRCETHPYLQSLEPKDGTAFDEHSVESIELNRHSISFESVSE